MTRRVSETPTTPNAPTAGDTALSAEERYRMHDAFLATAMKWHQRGNTTWYLEPEYVNVMFDAVFPSALLAARREVRALRDAAKDCADELEAEVRNRYGYPDVHPAMQWRYERDMESVETVRAALAPAQEEM